MNELKMTDWKTLYKKESWGGHNFGIEVRVSIDRDLNENDSKAMYGVVDQIEAAIMTETMRLDPEHQKVRQEERTWLLKCFGDDKIFVEEIPNGYSQGWEYSQSPWYKVTTSKGVITLGWRKRVIEISWMPQVGRTAEEIFPDENVTKFDRTIHAWGYEKAKEYISRLLA